GGPRAPPDRAEPRHEIQTELEVERLEILGDALCVNGLRQYDEAPLKRPAQENLSRRSPGCTRHGLDLGVTEQVALGEGAIGFDGDAERPAALDDVALLQKRMA